VIDAAAPGRTFGPYDRSWTSTDAILYALGVGSGAQELAFTTENSHDVPQRVLPTFGVVIALPTRVLRHLGRFNWGGVVHIAQKLTLHHPLPPTGEVTITEHIGQLWDKGEGGAAIVVTTADAHGPDGELMLSTEMTLMLRGEGGFGGERGPAVEPVAVPDRPSDDTVRQSTSPDQGLIYRLSGDRNPLHSDPWYATNKGGFPRPILHGLCTYGFAARALVGAVCAGDPDSVASIEARFSAPVFPGEQLTTHIWRTDTGARFQTLAGPDMRTALEDGVLTLKPTHD
jgi:acyl dehydratase